jgi:hypothetical protein
MRRRLGIGLLIAAAVLVLVTLAGPRGQQVKPYPAPLFSRNPAAWLNSIPLGPGDGRVYLVEVWSYG